MPGIAGINGHGTADECPSELGSMLASMKHEGFYISGTHMVPEMSGYAGWLAHRDPFGGRQALFNEQADIALLLSGECFADAEVQSNLRHNGHKLETSNDWPVHLYEDEGEQFIDKLNGLFSGLLVDQRRGKAFLFNDRYGSERIYWHQTKSATYFASEAKALLRVIPDLRKFDDEGVAQFLTYGCVLEGRTLF